MATRDDTPEPGFELRRWSAADAVQARHLHLENRAAWDDAAAEYAAMREKTLEFLRTGGSSLHPVERENLARIGALGGWCDEALHLQCASGRDTLSLLHEGARRVTGVDFSPVHIETARWLAGQLEAPAAFVVADVLDTPSELTGRFDLVYTGMGALCWLHDLDGWATVVARALRPGRWLSVFDNHPMLWLWDDIADHLRVYPGVSYFNQGGVSTGWSPGYLPQLGHNRPRKFERSWTFAEIINSLVRAGLHVEHLGEHREGYFDVFENLPPEELERIPLTFSLLARRPG